MPRSSPAAIRRTTGCSTCRNPGKEGVRAFHRERGLPALFPRGLGRPRSRRGQECPRSQGQGRRSRARRRPWRCRPAPGPIPPATGAGSIRRPFRAWAFHGVEMGLIVARRRRRDMHERAPFHIKALHGFTGSVGNLVFVLFFYHRVVGLDGRPADRAEMGIYRQVAGLLAYLGVLYLAFRVYFSATDAFPVGQENPASYAPFGAAAAIALMAFMVVASAGTYRHIRCLERGLPAAPKARFDWTRTLQAWGELIFKVRNTRALFFRTAAGNHHGFLLSLAESALRTLPVGADHGSNAGLAASGAVWNAGSRHRRPVYRYPDRTEICLPDRILHPARRLCRAIVFHPGGIAAGVRKRRTGQGAVWLSAAGRPRRRIADDLFAGDVLGNHR